MKTKAILCALAASLLFLSACKKSETESDNIDTNSENVAIVGTSTTNLTSTVWFDDFGAMGFDANQTSGSRVGFHGSVAYKNIGTTINLASPQLGEDYWIRYESDAHCFTQRYEYGSLYCDIDHDDAISEPIFASGTMTTKHIEGGYTLAIDGTLIDGTSVKINLKMSYTDEVIPLTPNSVILDGVKYEASASANTATNGITHWTLTGENIDISGNIYPYSDNLHAYLNEFPIGDGYRFDFAINIPGLQLSYDWNDDTLICQLDGETVDNPFASGDGEFNVYDNEVYVTIIGTLTNGKTIKVYVNCNAE